MWELKPLNPSLPRSSQEVSTQIKIGHITVGYAQPVFIIAEIGYNFTSLEEAIASIDAVKECGADAVKFQTFTADNLVIKNIDFPPEAGGGNQYLEFKQYELSPEYHAKLFSHARKIGLIPLSTPSSIHDIPLLEENNIAAYKTGADDLTNIPLHQAIALKNKPMMISTGMSDLSEVAETVSAIRQTGNSDILLFHTVSNYPVRDLSAINLRAMQTMADALQVLVGYSDHTTTMSAPVAAVAMGASAYERHFTLDKKMPCPDAALSADPDEMKEIVRMIRETEEMLGDGIKRCSHLEHDMRKNTRKSIVTTKQIDNGETFSSQNLGIKRPGYGIPPKMLDVLIGRTAQNNLPVDTVLSWDLV